MRTVFGVVLIGLFAIIASGQTVVPRTVITPPSSIAHPEDGGLRAHTNIKILGGAMTHPSQTAGPPFPGYFFETPASLACIYGLVPSSSPGCNPNVVTANPDRGSRAVAVVDAYDDPNAYSDLQTFSAQFGLAPITPSSFQVVYAPSGGLTPGSCATHPPGPQPPSAAPTGWDVEESLDIEYAHAMAPNATLYLVEAQSEYFTDLLCGVTVASNLVAKAGGGEVSMSWGTGEPAEFSAQYPLQTEMDPVFTKRGVVYFASAGDGPGAIWPSTSRSVVSAGGTTLSTDQTTGTFLVENTWQDGGGGLSAIEPRPPYQNGIAFLVGTQRGTPDIAAIANPNTGVWVLDTLVFGPGTWYIVGGTSVSSPLIAGIINAAGSFALSSPEELSGIYSHPFGFTDLTFGDCGIYIGNFATPGWDFCTGWGSPRGYSGK
jgi:subtilase family serine protease